MPAEPSLVAQHATAASASTRAEEIREAAGAIFLRKGYSDATMNDIANAVGILPGSLYHHFESKEAVAVSILEDFNASLHALAQRLRRSGHGELSAEMRLRELTREVALLSQQHAAAVRLRAYEPPTAASPQFRAAINFRPNGLYRLWNAATTELKVSAPRLDSELLSLSLQVLSVTLPTNQPDRISPEQSASIFCDSLLHGIASKVPSNEELNASLPMQAAVAAVERWHRPASDNDALKAEILAAARREFAQRGYEATTIRDIAAASGVRMGTIYRRVKSMDAMFEEIAGNYGAHLDAAMRAALTADTCDPVATIDALHFVVSQSCKRFYEETAMMRLAWSRPGAGQPQVQVTYRNQVAERMNLLCEIIEHGHNTGQLRLPASAEVYAPHLRSILWSGFDIRTRISRPRVRAFFREHLLRGVVADGSGRDETSG